MAFQSGQSGNPGGRVKRDFITQHIIAELKELTAEQVTKGRKLVIALIDKAMSGDVVAIREVIDRVEGKAIQLIGGDEDHPLRIERIERAIVHTSDSDSRSIPTAH